MALVLCPYARRLVPPFAGFKIDASHPLSVGMTDCLLWNAGGIPINLAAPSVNTTITGSPTAVMTANGPAGYSTGGSGYNIPDHGNICAADFAIRILVRIVSWPLAFAALVDKAIDSVHRELEIDFDTSGNINFVAFGSANGGPGDFLAISTGMTAGGTYDFVASRAGSLASFYVNGALVGSSSLATAVGGTTGVTGWPMAFGPTPGGANVSDAQYIAAQVWTGRALSAQEVASLAADPYGFLIPAEGEMPAISVFPTLTSGSSFGASYTGRIFPYRSRRQVPA